MGNENKRNKVHFHSVTVTQSISQQLKLFPFLFITECRDQYPNVCTLWHDYCRPEEFEYKVLKQSVEFIKANCPVTCKKCQLGQKQKSSRNLNGNWFFISLWHVLIWKRIYRRDIRMDQRNEHIEVLMSNFEESKFKTLQSDHRCSAIKVTKNWWAKPCLGSFVTCVLQSLNPFLFCLCYYRSRAYYEGTSVTCLTSWETEKDERLAAKQRASHCYRFYR